MAEREQPRVPMLRVRPSGDHPPWTECHAGAAHLGPRPVTAAPPAGRPAWPAGPNDVVSAGGEMPAP